MPVPAPREPPQALLLAAALAGNQPEPTLGHSHWANGVTGRGVGIRLPAGMEAGCYLGLRTTPLSACPVLASVCRVATGAEAGEEKLGWVCEDPSLCPLLTGAGGWVSLRVSLPSRWWPLCGIQVSSKTTFMAASSPPPGQLFSPPPRPAFQPFPFHVSKKTVLFFLCPALLCLPP